MRKSILLTSAFALAASFANAQGAMAPVSQLGNGLKMAPAMQAVQGTPGMVATPAKSASDGIWYTPSEGNIYNGYNDTWGAYRLCLLAYPAFSQVWMYNQSLNPSQTEWEINGSATSGEGDNNDFTYGQLPGARSTTEDEPAIGMFYLPTLKSSTSASSSFSYGEWAESDNGYSHYLSVFGEVQAMSFDPLTGGGQYAFGGKGTFTEGNYNYQTGNMANNLGKVVSIVSYYNKPAGPVWIQNVILPLLWHNNTSVVPSGKSIHVQFVETEKTTTETGEERWTLTDNVLADFEGKGSDLVQVGSQPTSLSTTGTLYMFTLPCYQNKTDEWGGETQEPAVIDKPFAVVLDGLDQDGVNFGLEALFQNESATPIADATYWVVRNSDNELDQYAWSTKQGSPKEGHFVFSFTGVMDAVSVMDNGYITNDDGTTTSFENLNVLKVSADGKTVENYGSSDMSYAIVSTALPWTDADSGIDNYSITDCPDWIEPVAQAASSSSYQNMFTVNCQALPAGTTGRVAKLYIEGKGVTSSAPVIVLQGDATMADGISSAVVTDNKVKNTEMYNLAGQKVGKNYKGIVVVDGKKIIKK